MVDFNGRKITDAASLQAFRNEDLDEYQEFVAKTLEGGDETRFYEDVTGAGAYNANHERDGLHFQCVDVFKLMLVEKQDKEATDRCKYLIGRVRGSTKLKLYKNNFWSRVLRCFGVVAFKDLAKTKARGREFGFKELQQEANSVHNGIYLPPDDEVEGFPVAAGLQDKAREIPGIGGKLAREVIQAKGTRVLHNNDEFTHVSSIFRTDEGGELLLGPLSYEGILGDDGRPIDRFVVVQGRQVEFKDGGELQEVRFPYEKHPVEGLGTWYFDHSLKNLDIDIRFNAQTKASDELVQSYVDRIITQIPEGYRESIDIEELRAKLRGALSGGGNVRIRVDAPPIAAEEIRANIVTALEDLPEGALKACVKLKDCPAELFAGEGGKTRIKEAIAFTVRELQAGRKVLTFCHQGKDRSAFLLLGTLLYLSKCKSLVNREKHNEIAHFLRTKRSIVNDGAALPEDGSEITDRTALLYLPQIIEAVTEMLDADEA